MRTLYWVKIVRIWSFSSPYFPEYGVNTEMYIVNSSIQFKCGKIRTRKALNMDTFHAALAWNGPIIFLFTAFSLISARGIFRILRNICDVLRNLVAFVQFKKHEKHPWRSVNFSKVGGFSLHKYWMISLYYFRNCCSLYHSYFSKAKLVYDYH